EPGIARPRTSRWSRCWHGCRRRRRSAPRPSGGKGPFDWAGNRPFHLPSRSRHRGGSIVVPVSGEVRTFGAPLHPATHNTRGRGPLARGIQLSTGSRLLALAIAALSAGCRAQPAPGAVRHPDVVVVT